MTPARVRYSHLFEARGPVVCRVNIVAILAGNAAIGKGFQRDFSAPGAAPKYDAARNRRSKGLGERLPLQDLAGWSLWRSKLRNSIAECGEMRHSNRRRSECYSRVWRGEDFLRSKLRNSIGQCGEMRHSNSRRSECYSRVWRGEDLLRSKCNSIGQCGEMRHSNSRRSKCYSRVRQGEVFPAQQVQLHWTMWRDAILQ